MNQSIEIICIFAGEFSQYVLAFALIHPLMTRSQQFKSHAF